MRRFTTPTIELVVKGVDLTGLEVYVTFSQQGKVLTVEQPTMEYADEDTTISVPLSQVQTGNFNAGNVEVQVNFIDTNGHRDATTIKAIEVDRNLLAKVVE